MNKNSSKKLNNITQVQKTQNTPAGFETSEQIQPEKENDLKQLRSFGNRMRQRYLNKINEQIQQIKSRKQFVQHSSNFQVRRVLHQPVHIQDYKHQMSPKQIGINEYRKQMKAQEQMFASSLYGFFQSSESQIDTYSNKISKQANNCDISSRVSPLTTREPANATNTCSPSPVMVGKLNSLGFDTSWFQEKIGYTSWIKQLDIDENEKELFYQKHSNLSGRVSKIKKPIPKVQKALTTTRDSELFEPEILAFQEGKSLTPRDLTKKIKKNITQLLNTEAMKSSINFLQKGSHRVIPQSASLSQARLKSKTFYSQKANNPEKQGAFNFFQSIKQKDSLKITKQLKAMARITNEYQRLVSLVDKQSKSQTS